MKKSETKKSRATVPLTGLYGNIQPPRVTCFIPRSLTNSEMSRESDQSLKFALPHALGCTQSWALIR
jgi:hypothetical protein